MVCPTGVYDQRPKAGTNSPRTRWESVSIRTPSDFPLSEPGEHPLGGIGGGESDQADRLAIGVRSRSSPGLLNSRPITATSYPRCG